MRLTGILRKSISFINRSQRINEFILKQFGVIKNIKTNGKIASLTFDDGPNEKWTPELLKILEKHNAKATFFIVGQNVEKNRKLITEIHEQGHTIGNHTWSHPSISVLNAYQLTKEVNKCDELLAQYRSNYFRPPYGHLSYSSMLVLRLMGYQVITWDAHPYDWKSISSAQILEDLNAQIRPGSIILLHDNVYERPNESRDYMLIALDKFLEAQSEYKFLSLDELLSQGEVILAKWYMR